MSPDELAVEIGKIVVECQSRITGIGAQQYYVPGEPQKFETMEFNDLATYYREELLDIVNYAVMTMIRIDRIQQEFSKRSSE